MSGAIMPAPLQKPLMTTVAPPILAVRVASLGKVSVVMIARAASSPGIGPGDLASPSSRCANLPASIGSPMTPVEAMKTSLGAAAHRLGGGLRRDARPPRGPSCR